MRTRSAALVLTLLLGNAAETQEPPANKPPPVAPPAVQQLAVIVNAKNPTTGLTLAELRSHFKLEVQFWSNNQRTIPYLRPSDSPEMKILLDRVYGTTPSELRKYWIGRVFRGEIPAVPTVVPTTAAAVSRVRDQDGAFSVILANEVPDGVRVLAIDGKRPGDPGYALTSQAAAAPAPAPTPTPGGVKPAGETGTKPPGA